MIQRLLTTQRRLAKGFPVLLLVLVCSVVASGQNAPAPISLGTPENRQRSSFEEEMRAKRQIEATDKAHKENLTKARNLATIGAMLFSSYKVKKHLDRTDLKSLEKAEKLAKSIREAAGGSNDECEIEDRPTDLGAALTQLSERTESLKTRVEKTPKHVVSAAVIDEANVLLELIRIVRSMQPKV
jgi:hypothetical protein